MMEETRAAEERAMLALEEARQQTTVEVERARGAEEKLKGVEEKLKGIESEVYAQEALIFDLRAQAQKEKDRADNAVQLAHYSDTRAETLSLELQAAKDKVAEAEKKAAGAEEKATEAEKKTAEAEKGAAEAEKRATEAVAAFRQSADFKREIAEATAQVYDWGFADCKSKMKQLSSLEGIEGVEPDDVEGPLPFDPVGDSVAPTDP